ncbi:MAG: glutathione S-transferase family protein [Deltaproteobacteria bacterium]|nr:glutathione S-transferase family protein [Deltaproteobacteria bacterium]
MSDPIVLHHFRVSHYNEKVRWALDFKRLPHLRKAYVPGFHVPAVRRLSGQNKVPVLVMGGRVVCGSDMILSELEAAHPVPPLTPSDPEGRARALALQKQYDDEVAPELRRIFWSTYLDDAPAVARMATDGFGEPMELLFRSSFAVMKPLFRRNMGVDDGRAEAALERLPFYFDRLESELGGREYLVGSTFTVADLAVASVMTAIVRPPEFPYPLPEPWPRRLVEIRASVSKKPAFEWVQQIYARHRGRTSELVS